MSKFLAASAGLALAGAALANSYNGAGFAIPDNSPAGASSVINVGDSFAIAAVSVTLNNLTHTWAGDLIATLSNSSTTVTLFNRPGFTGTGFGSSSDFGGNYTFEDGGASLAGALGGGGTFVIPSGTYAPATPSRRSTARTPPATGPSPSATTPVAASATSARGPSTSPRFPPRRRCPPGPRGRRRPPSPPLIPADGRTLPKSGF